MNILLFLPSSQLAYSILSEALYLKQNGMKPIYLSATPKGEMHRICKEYGITAYSLGFNYLNYKTYLSACYLLTRFIVNKKIDIIFSNNLQGNFIAVLSRFFHKKRTVLVRHHTDYIYLGNNENAKRQLRFVNKFGNEFIAISDRVKQQMIIEGVPTNKIRRINLGLDFNVYKKLDPADINQLKSKNISKLKICTIARLIPLKRHKLLFDAIRILYDQGFKLELWVIGDGPLINELKEWVHYYRLTNVIYFTGYLIETQNYLAASDLLIHISESEASSHVVREAAFFETPVLVCKDVGDFEDYIIDEVNGFFVDKNVNAKDLANKIMELSDKKDVLNKSALALKKTVLNHFDIKKSGKKLVGLITEKNQSL